MAKKARRRTVKRKPHREEPAERADVEQALAQLRSYYALGSESLEESPDRVKYGDSSELLRKARVFAQRYTPEDLSRIESLCRQHGTNLGRSLVDRLATVHNRSERRKLEEEAIAGRWSKIILDREIRKRFGNRNRDRERNPQQLGRKSKPPRSAQEALSDLVRLCVRLTRWAEFVGWDDRKVTGEIWGKDKDGYDVLVDTLPAEISGELQRTLRAVSKLQKAAEKELKASR